MTEVFQDSLDDLTQENGTARLEAALPDPELFAQFQAVAELDEEDKNAIKKILQAMIAKHQVKHIVGR